MNKNISTNKYGSYYIPASQLHRPVAATISRGGVHEPETINYIIDNLNNKSAITAGSYFGDFLPALCKGTSGTIYTFEPVPALFEYSKKTIQLNNLHNVVIENKALSNKDDYVIMELYGKRDDHLGKMPGEVDLLGGASRVVGNPSKTTIEVESVSLDSCIPIECEVSVLHLDVEGHEGAALMGAISLIKKNLPIIIVETSPREFFNEHLAPLGYKFIKMIQGNEVWAP